MIEINIPEVRAELVAVFARYEQALVTNDVPVLDELFWDNALTVRLGLAENLYGYEQIKAFRAARPAAGLARALRNTVITTYGRDFGTANTEFIRPPIESVGRQSQTWVRMPLGWRIVSAHVSWMKAET